MKDGIPEEDDFIDARLDHLDSKIEVEMSIRGLSNPNKEFVSWNVLESREQHIPGFRDAVKEKRKLAKRVHSRRSKQARAVDESFNAPVTTNYKKWRKNPNRYDFHNVDTIPRKKRIERIERYRKVAEKKGMYTEIIPENRTPKTLRAYGFFNMGNKQIHLAKGFHYPKHTRTLAHELSHAFDHFIGLQNGLTVDGYKFGLSPILNMASADEMKKAMEWTRDTKVKGTNSWSDKKYEQTAQFLSNFMYQPRAMKREFPILSRIMNQDEIKKFFK